MSVQNSRTLLFVFAYLPCLAMAQEAEDLGQYHPFLTDTFNIGVGGFWPQKSFEIRVDGSSPGDEVDFDEAFRFDDSEATASINFHWRFGEKWALGTQYWKVDSKGGTVLTDDLEWQDLTFKTGTFANAGIDVTVARIFFGRKFSSGPRHEFGLGAGFHWLEIGAFIEGEVIIDSDSTGFQRESVNAGYPLPNLGGWYTYSWSPKWLVQVRLDWLDVDIGDYSGGLWNGQTGIHYQAFENVGFGLAYTNFQLDVDVDKTDWHGRVETRQHGPRFSLTATW